MAHRTHFCLSLLPVIATCGCTAPPSDKSLTAPTQNAPFQRRMEDLSRGTIAVPADTGIAVSWRLLATEPQNQAFNLYRNGERINSTPLTGASFYLDTEGSISDQYAVAAENCSAPLEQTSVWRNRYLSIPLQRPDADGETATSYNYRANDGSAADLDGDGNYEIIVKWDPDNSKDNSHDGVTGPVFIDAYTLTGERLWRINLGKNIRAGAHYSPFIVYDFDGDGKAELAVRTADGSSDSQGKVIGDPGADYRDERGRVLKGPEYLSMFDGKTGKVLDTVTYLPERGELILWGDDEGNRSDRFLAGLAWLDEDHPSLLMTRGYYTRAVIAAWDWTENHFQQRWVFDSASGDASDATIAGQGAHSLTIGDVDEDGRDEIIYGAATVDDDGTPLYSTGLGHGDALHMSDIDPSHPGQEIFMVHESPSQYSPHGIELHGASDGEILWSLPGKGEDIGRGLSIDIDPRYPGNENFASSGELVSASGKIISNIVPKEKNFAIYWDGDLLRELLDDTHIAKWQPDKNTSEWLLDASSDGALSNNGTKATPVLSADLFGDWREEVIWRNSDSSELLIYASTIPTDIRLPTLMQDPQYRAAIAWQNAGYNQPPHTSFFLGNETSLPIDSEFQITGSLQTENHPSETCNPVLGDR